MYAELTTDLQDTVASALAGALREEEWKWE